MKNITVKPSRLFPDRTAILYIDATDLDLESIREFARSKELLEKDFFHLTVIGSRTADMLMKLIEKDTSLTDKINSLLQSNKWKVSIDEKRYFIEKKYEHPSELTEIRQSIIQLAKVEGGETFYSEIESLVGTRFELPFPHVTLFTNSSNPDKKLRGIGIYSENEFRDLSPILIQD